MLANVLSFIVEEIVTPAASSLLRGTSKFSNSDASISLFKSSTGSTTFAVSSVSSVSCVSSNTSTSSCSVSSLNVIPESPSCKSLARAKSKSSADSSSVTLALPSLS